MAGHYGMLTNIFINAGVFFSFLCGMLLTEDLDNVKEDESWKLVTSVPAFIGLTSLFFAVVFFPEEPVGWYVANDRMEDAKRSITQVYRVCKKNKDEVLDEAEMKFKADALFDNLLAIQRSQTSMN